MRHALITVLAFCVACVAGTVDAPERPADEAVAVVEDDTGAPPPSAPQASAPPDETPASPPESVEPPGPVETEPAAPARVPMLLAMGQVGTTAFSCDDGRSWVGLHTYETEGHPSLCPEVPEIRCKASAEAPAVCGKFRDNACSTTCNCDHIAGSGRGAAYADGYFYVQFGNAAPAELRRSSDGIEWESISGGLPANNGLMGLIRAGDRFVIGGNRPHYSSDGIEWQEAGAEDGAEPPSKGVAWIGQATRGFFHFSDAQVFVQTYDDDLRVSSDLVEWIRPEALPEGCGRRARASAGHGETLVILHRRGNGDTANPISYVCTSIDGGEHFTKVPIAKEIDSLLFFDGLYSIWGREEDRLNKVWTSTDGLSWSARETDLPGRLAVGGIFRNPETGTLVMATEHYEKQRWWRSVDGMSWSQLDVGLALQTHPIRGLAFGYALENEWCEAP